MDCAAGASGDMFLGALVDAGVPLELLQQAVDGLPTEPIELRAHTVERHSIGASAVDVITPPDPVHRAWREIRRMLDAAELDEPVRALAHDAFARLARAEAKVHRIDPEDVHFHEVGALDAIADIVGTVTLGSGRARGSHGVIPVPGPATLLILAEAGAPCIGGPAAVEMCTPTGAALIASIADGFDTMPPMRPLLVGSGAGARDLTELPNLLRLVIGAESRCAESRWAAALRPAG